MKKVLVVVALVVLVSSVSAFAQGPYLVDYYANNSGPVPGAADQVLRLVNTGQYGTPMTSPTGDICSNIYVFDNNQEMIACCYCRTTPNELAAAWVGTQLTNNPVTSVVPAAGVIKVVNSLPAPGCDPTAIGETAGSIVAFATHLQSTGGATFVTETNVPDAALSADEFSFLQTACSFAQYLGSGKGTCSCSVPGD
jgi:hypothetical protein